MNDPTGSSALYFSFAGNSGLGAGCGFKGGIIKPSTSNLFSVDDFKGSSNSWSVGLDSPIGGYSIERGGTRGNSFSNYGTVTPTNTRPYTYIAGNVGDASPSVSVGAMISGSKTWTYKFD